MSIGEKHGIGFLRLGIYGASVRTLQPLHSTEPRVLEDKTSTGQAKDLGSRAKVLVGLPVERLDIEQGYLFFGVVYFGRGTLPQKKGRRPLLGDLVVLSFG